MATFPPRPRIAGPTPGARLLSGKQWGAVREDVLAGSSPGMPAEEHLAELVRALGAGRRPMSERLVGAGPAARAGAGVAFPVQGPKALRVASTSESAYAAVSGPLRCSHRWKRGA